jgi:hypothetical protein
VFAERLSKSRWRFVLSGIVRWWRTFPVPLARVWKRILRNPDRTFLRVPALAKRTVCRIQSTGGESLPGLTGSPRRATQLPGVRIQSPPEAVSFGDLSLIRCNGGYRTVRWIERAVTTGKSRRGYWNLRYSQRFAETNPSRGAFPRHCSRPVLRVGNTTSGTAGTAGRT